MIWQPGKQLIVETERFMLRSMCVDDINSDYIRWWNDPEIQEGLNALPRDWNKQHAIQHVQKFDNRTSFHLGIHCKAQQKLIGFFAMFISPGVNIAKTNVVIGEKDYWGKKVVQEIRPKILDFLFNELKMVKVKGEIMGRSYASIFNYKALGFTCEGILRNELKHYKEGRTDLYIFGLLKEEWENKKSPENTSEQ